MKVAVIGSRELNITDLGKYLPSDTSEIISGGAKGADTPYPLMRMSCEKTIDGLFF